MNHEQLTPGAQRAISPSSQLRSDLRTFLALIAAVMAVTATAAIWATTLQAKVDYLIERQARQDAGMDEIRAALGIAPAAKSTRSAPVGP